MAEFATPNSYDQVPYPLGSYPESHPDRLAVLAALFGIEPAPVDHCRVLEIGCAEGGNLLPMAELLPGSQFTGIDRSARQIAQAKEYALAMGLKNVDLGQADLMQIPPGFGPFEYIIAHGVYSWVPPPVQDRLLQVIKNSLTPNGIAYLSYNTYPGWHGRRAIREMMLYHTRKQSDAKSRVEQARALLSFLVSAVPPKFAAYRQLLLEEQSWLTNKPDGYLFHDQLEDQNLPCYFHELVAKTQNQGLQYLAEANIGSMFHQEFAPETAAAFNQLGEDFLSRQQYLDFATNRSFRQSLFCHAELARAGELQLGKLAGFHIAAWTACPTTQPDIVSNQNVEFRGSQGCQLTTGHPLSKAALVHLARIYPSTISFEALHAAAHALLFPQVSVDMPANYQRESRKLAETLLQGFLSEVVELHSVTSPAVAETGDRPRASTWARLCSQHSLRVTNVRHEMVALDELGCFLLGLLDGTRTRQDLLELMIERVTSQGLIVQKQGRPIEDPVVTRSALAEGLAGQLRALAGAAFLMGPKERGQTP